MIRRDDLPEPPVNDILCQIENLIKWDYGRGKKADSFISIELLEQKENQIRSSLSDHILKLIDTRSYANDKETTENEIKLSMRQASDVGKLITGVYAALQGRDNTRRLTKDE